MSSLHFPAPRWFLPVFALLAILLTNGCMTPDSSDSSAAAQDFERLRQDSGSEAFRVGDKITITLGDIPMGPIISEQTIGEDGYISLHLDVRVQAAGKTVAKLQEDIKKAYVPNLYKRISVAIKSEDRFFFVAGEVKNPSRQPYLGEMSVLKAISAAGDYTDFANKKRIEVIRANGRKEKVDGVKALKDPKLDLPIFPGDRVYVHRRGI